MLLRAPATLEQLAARRIERRTMLQITCGACKAVLHRATVRERRAQPKTFDALVRQAFESHKRETGCSGAAPAPELAAPGDVEVLAGV